MLLQSVISNDCLIQWGNSIFYDNYGGEITLPTTYTTLNNPLATHYTEDTTNTSPIRTCNISLSKFSTYGTIAKIHVRWLSIGY